MEHTRFGKYILVEKIATGGMAEIFKALALGVDGHHYTLAIKRILPQYSNDEEFISLLIDEAKLMVHLNHPSIVPIVEFGKIDDSYFIAMDFVEGTTLKNLFKRVRKDNDQFTLDLVVHIVREIGTGLAYAHRKLDESGKPLNIVHRDISPANILVSFDGEVKIVDFGISKASNQSHKTEIGIIRGKTGYMSPEQTRANLQLDCRSDLFSLGIIFWELVTGERLFKADSVPEALRMIREANIPSVRKIRPTVPRELEAILNKALDADLEKRFQRAEEFVDALNEFLIRWSPAGRKIRVTHTDLIGFLRRYYKREMEEKREETEVTGFEPGAPSYGETTRSQVFAANPQYELSSPEKVLSGEVIGGETNVSSQDTSPRTVLTKSSIFSNVVMKWRNLRYGIQAEVGRILRQIPPFLYAVLGTMLLVLTLVLVIFRNEAEDPNVISPPLTEASRPEKAPLEKPTPVPTQKPSPKMFTVNVETDPPGARVKVGEDLLEQQTPLLISSLQVGKTYSIELFKNGYETERRSVSTKFPKQINLRLVLERKRATRKKIPVVGPPAKLGSAKKPGRLTVGTKPYSVLWVDGKKIDNTPVYSHPIQPGRRRIRYEFLSGNRDAYEFTLRVAPGGRYKCLYDSKRRKNPNDCRKQ